MSDLFYFFAAISFSFIFIAFGVMAALHDHSWVTVMDKILPIVTLWTQAPRMPTKPGSTETDKIDHQ